MKSEWLTCTTNGSIAASRCACETLGGGGGDGGVGTKNGGGGGTMYYYNITVSTTIVLW